MRTACNTRYRMDFAGSFICVGKLDKGCVVCYRTLTASADLSIFGRQMFVMCLALTPL